MGFVKLTLEYSYIGQNCVNTFHYWRANEVPTISKMANLLDVFDDVVVDALKGIHPTQVSYTRLSAFAPNVGFSVDHPIGGTGDLVLASADLTPPDVCLICKRVVGQTLVNETGGVYSGNRQIRGGRFYLSALDKAFMDSTGVNDAAIASAAFTAFDSACQANLTAADGVVWQPVVVGLPLDAVPPTPTNPFGKDSRPYVIAPIVSQIYPEWSDLATRNQ